MVIFALQSFFHFYFHSDRKFETIERACVGLLHHIKQYQTCLCNVTTIPPVSYDHISSIATITFFAVK